MDKANSGIFQNGNDHIREKLANLLMSSGYFINIEVAGCVANYLITHGVTINEWIPVSERLPKKEESVLVYFDSGNMAVGHWYDKDECISFWQIWIDDGWVSDADCEPIYWMPLPPAPKGE